MTRGRITSKVAICFNCVWKNEDYMRDVAQLARYHAKKYGHKTQVETVYCNTYDYSKASLMKVSKKKTSQKTEGEKIA